MPAVSTLTINNGAAAPVAKTFTRSVEGDGKVSFYERSATTPMGFVKILFNVYQPKSENGTTRIEIDIYQPTTAVVDSKVVKLYHLASSQRHYLPGIATQADIDDLLAFNGNLLLNANVKTAFRNREGMFA